MASLLMFLGVLSLCSLCLSQECVRGLERDVDFPQSDIKTLYSPDARHCQGLCTQEPSCKFFTFVKVDSTTDSRNFHCYLKSNPTGQPNTRTPQQGHTSGFSLKFCPKDPLPCLYQNVDFPGADYRALFTADAQGCERACAHDPRCSFFTFNTNRYKCFLKFSWTIPTTPIVKRHSEVTSGFSHKVTWSPDYPTACQPKLFPETDIQGGDLQTLSAATPLHCLALCSNHPLCTVFSFDSKDFQCYLKNQNDMVTSDKKGLTSGLPSRGCRLDRNLFTALLVGVDLEGADFHSELLENAQACQKACTEMHTCHFYAYAHKSHSNPSFRKRCYLKSAITLPAPPKVTQKDQVVSGFPAGRCS